MSSTNPPLEMVRARIVGPEPVLAVEAPAGYGKTHEAVEAARRLAPTLDEPRRVLFLTHTNGARDTFNRRLRALKAGSAVMRTIHSLAAEIVDVYASPLGLPRPLDPYRSRPSFSGMIDLASQILERRPEVARGLAARHPAILVDEYQDCDLSQHQLIQQIAEAGSIRLRLFGDHLQGIFDWDQDQKPVDFQSLTAAHPTVQLQTPRRWPANLEMADFVVEVRRSLLAGEPVDLRSPPPCVTVRSWDGDVPGPGQEGHVPACLELLRALNGDVVVLTHHNSHALGLRSRLPGRGHYHEGAEHKPAHMMLEQIVEAEGDAPRLSTLLVRVMRDWGQGMSKQLESQASEVCKADGVEIGTKRKIAPLAQLFERLYDDPSAARWLDCLRVVLEHGVVGWRALRPDQLWLLARLRPGPDDDPGALLSAASRAADALRPAPRRGFMVIHKAKGLEFPQVAIPFCSASLFADDLPSRKRLYVALTRAQDRLHILVPSSDPSPLLRL
jgi:hypothetical protein